MVWRQWHWQKGSPAEDQKSEYQRDGSGRARETVFGKKVLGGRNRVLWRQVVSCGDLRRRRSFQSHANVGQLTRLYSHLLKIALGFLHPGPK